MLRIMRCILIVAMVVIAAEAGADKLIIDNNDGWHALPYEAQITGIAFELREITRNSEIDFCLEMGPQVSPPGYVLLGVGGFTELVCIWTNHRMTNNSARHVVFDLSATPLYAPPGTSLNCATGSVGQALGLKQTCTISYTRFVAGSPRHRILRLPYIDQVMSNTSNFVQSYWKSWDAARPLHVKGAIFYFSFASGLDSVATLRSCIEIVQQDGSVAASECAPVQRSGSSINYDSPALVTFDRFVQGPDLLTSTCSGSGSKIFDCAAYLIAEIPNIPVDGQQVTFYDLGAATGVREYCAKYAALAPPALDLCRIGGKAPGCSTQQKIERCESIFPASTCLESKSCFATRSRD